MDESAPKIEEAAAQSPESAEIQALRAEIEAVRRGVRPECARDVVTLASGLQGQGDCAEAISRIIAKYPHFLSAPVPGAPNPPGAGNMRDPFLQGFRGL